MPYIIIRGNLASYSHKYPWRVLVSGLKGKSTKKNKTKSKQIAKANAAATTPTAT